MEAARIVARTRREKVIERIAQPRLFQVFKEENGWKRSRLLGPWKHRGTTFPTGQTGT